MKFAMQRISVGIIFLIPQLHSKGLLWCTALFYARHLTWWKSWFFMIFSLFSLLQKMVFWTKHKSVKSRCGRANTLFSERFRPCRARLSSRRLVEKIYFSTFGWSKNGIFVIFLFFCTIIGESSFGEVCQVISRKSRRASACYYSI